MPKNTAATWATTPPRIRPGVPPRTAPSTPTSRRPSRGAGASALSGKGLGAPVAQWRDQVSIQVLLPLARPDGRPVTSAEFDSVKSELAERYGGITAYAQAPAEGLWRDGAE